MKLHIDITQVQRWDIVEFKAYRLRVEKEPIRGNGSIRLEGRIDTGGCPIVKKHFLAGRKVTVSRGEVDPTKGI